MTHTSATAFAYTNRKGESATAPKRRPFRNSSAVAPPAPIYARAKQLCMEADALRPAKFFPHLLFILIVAVSKGQVQARQQQKPSEIQSDSANMVENEQFANNSEVFGRSMYLELSSMEPSKNCIFSPFSILASLGMVRMGAEGRTAEEIDKGLGLVSHNANTIADRFNHVLAIYKDSLVLRIANKIYVMAGHTIQKEFNEIVSDKFFSSAEELDFKDNVQAAHTINNWVESKTNNLIQNIISPDLLNADTRIVLVNAIHFKGEWLHKFPKYATQNENFYLNEKDTVKVPMMTLKERLRYGVIPELDAAVLEMPYKDSDLSMMVFLPNSRTGLKDLEQKLKNISLSDIKKKMNNIRVVVKFPKFKSELSITLNEPLEKLGMSRMFSEKAEFGKMLATTDDIKISKIIHKAFIEVNEEGTEAAAATACLMRMKRSIEMGEEFIADHPFLYFINSQKQLTTATTDEHFVYASPIPIFIGTHTVVQRDLHDSPKHSDL